MSIYIKVMEMPRSCFYCPFQHKTTTECLITHKYYNWGLTTPPSDCPIIPVPPHGRLGDLDALTDKVIGKYIGHERKNELIFAAAEIKQDICDLIGDAPTIIPAEEGET